MTVYGTPPHFQQRSEVGWVNSTDFCFGAMPPSAMLGEQPLPPPPRQRILQQRIRRRHHHQREQR